MVNNAQLVPLGKVLEVSDSDFVGIGGTTPQVQNMVDLSKKIKAQNSKIKIAVGGFGVSIRPELMDKIDTIDHICFFLYLIQTPK